MLGALFGFSGRLSRPGFWEVLMSVVLIDAALVIGRMYVADSGLPGGLGPAHPLSQALLGAAPWALVIFTLWSGLAAMVKRCHDRDRTGFLVLVGLIPVIGWLWLLIDLFFLEGTEGRNRYGKAPHGPDTPARSRFEWGAESAAPEEPAPAPQPPHRMMDPEPVFEQPAPSDVQAHEPRLDAPDAHAEAALSEPSPVEVATPAHAEAPEPDADAVMEPAPRPAPEPMPELVQDHTHDVDHGDSGPAPRALEPEPYDPLEAPLVLNIR